MNEFFRFPNHKFVQYSIMAQINRPRSALDDYIDARREEHRQMAHPRRGPAQAMAIATICLLVAYKLPVHVVCKILLMAGMDGDGGSSHPPSHPWLGSRWPICGCLRTICRRPRMVRGLVTAKSCLSRDHSCMPNFT